MLGDLNWWSQRDLNPQGFIRLPSKRRMETPALPVCSDPLEEKHARIGLAGLLNPQRLTHAL